MKKTVLNKWHKSQGGDLVNFAGWEMPFSYNRKVMQEHLNTRRNGSLFDISHMGRFIIKGRGSLDFLQYVLTNDASKLIPKKAQYTIIPDENGFAIDDAYLYQIKQNEYLLIVNASNKKKDIKHLKEQIKYFSNVQLVDKERSLAMIALQGPKTEKVLEEIIGKENLPKKGRNNLSITQFEGKELIISRTGYTGEPICFELFVHKNSIMNLCNLIIEAGEIYGISPAGLGARDTLRLEAGLPLYGHELGLDPEGKEIPIFALPQAKYAVDLSSKSKKGLIGKEALEKQKENNLTKIVQVLISKKGGVIKKGDKIYLQKKRIGYVTSGAKVPYWRFISEINKKKDKELKKEEKGIRCLGMAYTNLDKLKRQKVIIETKMGHLEGQIVLRNIKEYKNRFVIPVF